MMTVGDSLGALRHNAHHNDKFKKERWITLAEACVITDLVRSQDVTLYFESGTANGFSTCMVADAMHDRFFVFPPIHTWDPVDRPKVWYETRYEHLGEMIVFHNERYTASVKELVPVVRAARGGGKALFFIDGDHRMRPARNDIRNTLVVAQPGDVIVLHDIKHYEWLRGRFAEFQETHKTEFFDTDRGMGAVWVG